MRRGIWESIREFLICVTAMACLLFAGSDSPYFPWPNVIATLVFAIIVMAYLRNSARRDILTWADADSALETIRDLKRRVERLNSNRSAANAVMAKHYSVNIHAVDGKSFAEMCARNPNALVDSIKKR
ncbi:MAG: hypothetical protein ABSG75_11050 [Syntrophales bacterium]|jgi:hypothetical protein